MKPGPRRPISAPQLLHICTAAAALPVTTALLRELHSVVQHRQMPAPAVMSILQTVTQRWGTHPWA
jgi:hypothetical protein